MSVICLLGLHNWWYGEFGDAGWYKCSRCGTLKNCKYCKSSNLLFFAGIGADGILCNTCDKIQ